MEAWVSIPQPIPRNQLFSFYLGKLIDEVEDKTDGIIFVFKKAKRGIEEFLQPLYSGEDARQKIRGVGPYIASLLDQAINTPSIQEEFMNFLANQKATLKIGEKRENDARKNRKGQKRRQSDLSDSQDKTPRTSISRRKSLETEVKKYQPKKYTGGWAILLVLLDNQINTPINTKMYLYKSQIVERSSPLSFYSFSYFKISETKFSCWDSINTLLKHSLVKTGSFANSENTVYFLTTAGVSIAWKIIAEFVADPEQPAVPPPPDSAFNFEYINEFIESLYYHSHSPYLRYVTDEASVTERQAQTKIPDAVGEDDEYVVIDTPFFSRIKNKKQYSDFYTKQLERNIVKYPMIYSNYLRQRMRPELLQVQHEIVLLVDNREIQNLVKRTETFIYQELEKCNINIEYRSLTIGDYIWVMRPIPCSSQNEEIILDSIAVERKSLTDLVASLQDGRMNAQAGRLRTNFKKMIYIIEGDFNHLNNSGSIWQHSYSQSEIFKILHAFQMAYNAVIKYTLSSRMSALYLEQMSRHLAKKYAGESFNVLKTRFVSYSVFNTISAKSFCITTRELFARQLSTIRGCSSEVLSTLLRAYPTVNAFLATLDQLSEEREAQKALLNSLLVYHLSNEDMEISEEADLCEIICNAYTK